MFNSIKTQANVLGKLFEKHGIKLTRAEQLEAMAQIYGCKDFNSLAPVTKPLSESAQNATQSKYKSIDQLRLNASTLDLVRGLSAGEQDNDAQAFQNIQSLTDTLLGSEQAQAHYPLLPFELSHAKSCKDIDYGAEIVLRTASGYSLACPCEDIDYIRVLSPLGEEIGYWVIDELQEDASTVLGGLMGMLARGDARFSSQDKQEPQTVDPSLAEIFFVGNWGDSVDFEMRVSDNQNNKSNWSEYLIMVFVDKRDFRVSVGDIRYSQALHEDFADIEPNARQRKNLLAILTNEKVAQSLSEQIGKLLKENSVHFSVSADSLMTAFDRSFGNN